MFTCMEFMWMLEYLMHMVVRFENILHFVFKVNSIKECLNILLLSDGAYALWEKVLWEWENGNILDEIGKLPTKKVAPIRKSTFNCLVGLHEFQMAMLAQGLLDHKYILVGKVGKFWKGH